MIVRVAEAKINFYPSSLSFTHSSPFRHLTQYPKSLRILCTFSTFREQSPEFWFLLSDMTAFLSQMPIMMAFLVLATVAPPPPVRVKYAALVSGSCCVITNFWLPILTPAAVGFLWPLVTPMAQLNSTILRFFVDPSSSSWACSYSLSPGQSEEEAQQEPSRP